LIIYTKNTARFIGCHRGAITKSTSTMSAFRGKAFREAAFENSDRHLFTQALDQFYGGGQPDDRTLKLLG
jgi:uncharacterized protein (DUF1810 family)